MTHWHVIWVVNTHSCNVLWPLWHIALCQYKAGSKAENRSAWSWNVERCNTEIHQRMHLFMHSKDALDLVSICFHGGRLLCNYFQVVLSNWLKTKTKLQVFIKFFVRHWLLFYLPIFSPILLSDHFQRNVFFVICETTKHRLTNHSSMKNST